MKQSCTVVASIIVHEVEMHFLISITQEGSDRGEDEVAYQHPILLYILICHVTNYTTLNGHIVLVNWREPPLLKRIKVKF